MNGPAQIYPPAPARVGLTERQRDCFETIETFIATHKRSPSYNELRIGMGLKTKGRIHFLLTALQERGWITFLPRRARSIAIVPADGPYILPVNVAIALRGHCAATGEDPQAIVADAVMLFLDEAEGSVAA